MRDLHPDIVHHVCAQCEASTVLLISTVCSVWKKTTHNDQVWQHQCRKLVESKQGVALKQADHETWKQTYIRLCGDAKRTVITAAELLRGTWSFRFKQDLFNLHATAEEKAERARQPPFRGTFHSNGTYTSNIPGAPAQRRPLPWLMRDVEQLHGLEAAGRIQIAAYPPLKGSRVADWGWKLENEYVELISVKA